MAAGLVRGQARRFLWEELAERKKMIIFVS